MSTQSDAQVIFEQFCYTLSLGKVSTLSLSDDEISCYLFEECEVGVISFLEDGSLEALSNANLLTPELVTACRDIRGRWNELSRMDQSIAEIRMSGEWISLLRSMEDVYSQVINDQGENE